MKKQMRIAVCLLSFVLLVGAAFGLASCGKGCKHEWQDATCTAPKTCKLCSETEGSALGHSYTVETVKAEALKSAATCQGAAVYYKSCACGAIGTAETFTHGEPLAHSYTVEEEKESALKSAGSCTEKPVYYKSCACGAVSTNEADTFEGSTPTHTYNQEKVSEATLKSAATCEGAAVYYKSCSCGAVSTASTDVFSFGTAPPHTYDRETVMAAALKSAATCESAAVYYKSCACGAVSTDVALTFTSGQPAPHAYTLEVVMAETLKEEASCESAAVYYKSCACGLVSEDETQVFENGTALPHNYQEVVEEATAATCVAAATKTYRCACGDEYEETVGDALGHNVVGVTPDEVAVPDTSCEFVLVYICQRADCGAQVEGEHVFHHEYAASVTQDAICNEDGVKTLSCACGDTKTEPIPMDPTGHKWQAGNVASGKRTDTCEHCGETRVVVVSESNSASVNASDLKNAEIELKVDADTNAGIKLDDGVIDTIGNKNVTVSADKLSDQDKVNLGIDENKLAQVGNNPIYNFTMSDGDQPISQFGADNYVTITLPYTLAPGEDVDSVAVWFINGEGEVESIKAVYNNGFVTFKTNHFSYYTVTRLTPAERCALYGHNYAKSTVVGSCTKDGYDLFVCIRCHESHKENEVVAQGHDYEEEIFAASCTENGYARYTCKNCDHTYTQRLVATGHSFVAGETVTASCTVNGSVTYACSKCDATYTETYAKLAHTLSDTVVPASCEAGGYTLHKCSVCAYSYEDTFVPALGHAYGAPVWAWSADRATVTATFTCANDVAHTAELAATVSVTVTNGTCSNFVRTTHTAAVSHMGVTYTDEKIEETGTPDHVYGEALKFDTNGHWHECTCGAKDQVVAHTYGAATESKAPTCVMNGESVATCVCGATKTEVLPATGEHVFTDGVCAGCGMSSEVENFYLTMLQSFKTVNGFAIRLENFSLQMSEEGEDGFEVYGTATQLDFVELYLMIEDGELQGAGRGKIRIDDEGDVKDYGLEALIKNGYIYVVVDDNGCMMRAKVSLERLVHELLDEMDGDIASMEQAVAFFADTVLPTVEALVESNAAEINDVLAKLFNIVCTTEKQSDGTTVISLDFDKLEALNEALATQSVSEVIDLYFGEGTFDAIVDEILEILNLKVSEIPAYLEEMGLDTEDLFAKIDAYCLLIGAPEEFSIADVLTEGEYADVVLGVLLFDDEDYAETVEAVATMLRENALYLLIAEGEEEMVAEAKEGVAGIIAMLKDAVSFSVTVDKTGNVTDFDISVTELHVEADGEAMDLSFALHLGLNQVLDVTWNDITDEIDAGLVEPEEDTLDSEEETYFGRDYREVTYKGVTYWLPCMNTTVLRTDYDTLVSAMFEKNCGDWMAYELAYAQDYFGFLSFTLYDEELECDVTLYVDALTGETVVCVPTENGMRFEYEDGTEKTLTDAELQTQLMTEVYTLIFGKAPTWERHSYYTAYHDFYYNNTTKEYAYEDQHDIETKYELLGESCEDGVTETETCRACDYAYTWTYNWHRTFEDKAIDLSEHSACGGSISYYACLCGEETYVDRYFDYDYSRPNETQDNEGRTVYETTYVCEECGLRYNSAYYVVADPDNCREIRFYTDTVTVGNILVDQYQYTEEYDAHAYAVEYELRGEDCYDGVDVFCTCTRCGDFYSDWFSWHREEEVERIPLGSDCGGYASVYACPCGYNSYVELHEKCDLQSEYTVPWVEGVLDDSQYTAGGYNSFYSYFYEYVCAVTHPEVCGYVIRRADYWVKAEDACRADCYVVWQFGYDEATGTCEYEYVIKTESRTYHDYTHTQLENGWRKECADCGSYVQRTSVESTNGSLTYEVRENTLDDGETKYYEYRYEYDCATSVTTEYYKEIYADGSEWEQQTVDTPWTDIPFGDSGRKVLRVTTASNGETYTYERWYVTFTDSRSYTVFERTEDGDYWSQNDYTYSFEGECICYRKYTNSYGDSWTYEENCCWMNYGSYTAPTCTQDGFRGEQCIVCGRQDGVVLSPLDHQWTDSISGFSYCVRCGMENVNGVSGDVVIEDLTRAYGGGEYYVAGYWVRTNVQFTYFVSLVLENGDLVDVVPVTVFELGDMRALAFSKTEVERWAEEQGCTAYAVRLSFVPYGSDGRFDYAITFTDGAMGGTITGDTYLVEYIGAGEEVRYVITPEADGTWTFTSYADGDLVATLYDANGIRYGYSDDDGDGRNFKIICALNAGETYTLCVRWWSENNYGMAPLLFEVEY